MTTFFAILKHTIFKRLFLKLRLKMVSLVLFDLKEHFTQIKVKVSYLKVILLSLHIKLLII